MLSARRGLRGRYGRRVTRRRFCDLEASAQPESRTTGRRRQAENKGETTSALSAGSNALLQLGAAPALGVDDVLEAIGVVVRRSAPVELEGNVALVLATLRDAAATADELARATGLPAADVAALVVELELDGRVWSEDGIYRATDAA
jgi:predicted Rossmann fold nucleotide-binding protein DprA/Smf involved in DNA uptake